MLLPLTQTIASGAAHDQTTMSMPSAERRPLAFTESARRDGGPCGYRIQRETSFESWSAL